MDFSRLVFVDAEMPPRAEPRKRRRQIASQLCPTCDERFPASARTRVYCGIQCHDEAKAVRNGRRQYGKALPPDVAYALHMTMAHALRGGYNEGARRLSKVRRAEVRQRDDGCCVRCGAPGEEIDHVGGPSDELTNLRLLCRPCHHEVTDSHMRPIRDPEALRRDAALWQRISSAEPLRPCDADDWQHCWRQWVQNCAEYANAP